MPPELSSAWEEKAIALELSSAPVGESDSPGTEFRPGRRKQHPGTEFRPDRRVLRSSDEVSGTGFRLGGESDSPGIEFHPGRKKQIPRN